MSMMPISKPIRPGTLPDWNDLNKTRGVFRGLGLYDDDQDGPMLDGALVKAVKGFQKAKNLIVDGVINPGGETENALFKEKTGRPHPNFERTKLAQLESTGTKVGFGGTTRGVSSGKDPHNPNFGLIADKNKAKKENVKNKSSDTPLRKQTLEEANRNLFKLSDQWVENWKKERKELNSKEKTQRFYISSGRLFGLDSASENLEHFLDGQGRDKKMTQKDVEKRPFLKNAAEENNQRFKTKTFKEGGDQSKKLLNLKDGQETEINDHWVKKITKNDHLVNLRGDEALATGNSHVKSDVTLKASRKGNNIIVEGVVDHNWNDLYDFDKDQYPDQYDLQQKGRADNYKINANWKQKIKMHFELKNGKLINKGQTLENLKE